MKYKPNEKPVRKENLSASDRIEGRNPVIEALNSGRTIDKVYVRSGDKEGSILKILAICRERGIPIIEAEKSKLDAMSTTHSHQGVIAAASAKEYSSVDDIISEAEKRNEAPFIVVCDQINDPHNLGSIIRSANCAGAHGIIIPKRNAVGLTSAVAKASAGAVEYTRVAKVPNLARTIDMLKDKNIWIVGADMTGSTDLFHQDFSGGIAIVVGSEGFGLSRLVREKCDYLVNIPMMGEINSLNASVAGALMLYEVVRARMNG